jgi:hypothetical protein
MKITIERRELAAQEDDEIRREALALFDAMAGGRDELTVVWDALSAVWLSRAHPWVRSLLGLRVVARGADLRGADLRRANLSGADLFGADLRGADLRRADLRGADLEGANLRGADLRRADLRDASLGGAGLAGAIRSPLDAPVEGWGLEEDRLVRAGGEAPAALTSAESAELRPTLEALLDAEPARREQALGRLKALYVRCDDQGCTTRAEVAAAALPYATRALASPDAGVRVAGARALGLLAPDARRELGALAGALDDQVVEVRVAALDALGEFGETAAPFARPVAARLGAGATAEERAAAAQVLINAGVAAGHAEALIEALLRDEPGVQAVAAAALAHALEGAGPEERERISRSLRAAGGRGRG